MEKITKTMFDLLVCDTILKTIGESEFVQDLIISIIIVFINFLILPLLKKLISKIKWLNKEEKKQLTNETEKIADEITEKLDKNNKK